MSNVMTTLKLPTSETSFLYGEFIENARREALVKEGARREAKRAALDEEKRVLDGILSRLDKNSRLVPAQGSQLHKLIEAHHAGKIIYSAEEMATAKWPVEMAERAQSFVMQHDWQGALSGFSEFDEGTFRFPAPFCVFEFQFTNIRALVFTVQDDGIADLERNATWTALGPADGWWAYGDPGFAGSKYQDYLNAKRTPNPKTVPEFEAVCWDQIRAASIALEAEICEAETIRAPAKLNQRRAKRGKPPIREFHVVSLARRLRATRLEPTGDKRQGPRLHFRRGHWRHYNDHKTWIKWTLVGDPDLGFIDKEYRL